MQTHVSLKRYNSFQVEAFAKYFQEISDLSNLSDLSNSNSEPIFILGEGCNTLFTKDWPGLVLKNNLQGIQVLSPDSIQVASGHNWHDLVTWAVNHNLSGIENLGLIPGSVGAAIAGNIAAYGQSVSDTLISVDTLNLTTNRHHTFPASELELAYRTSRFKTDLKSHFITSAVFRFSQTAHFATNFYERRLSLQDELKKINPSGTYSIKDVYQAVINIRTLKLPDWRTIGTDGSVFKNPFVSKTKYLSLLSHIPELQWYPTTGMSYPSNSSTPPDVVKIPAGRLLDELGWRGKTIGRVSTYSGHALVVINLGKATGQEIFEYCELMRADILKNYGLNLDYEIEVV